MTDAKENGNQQPHQMPSITGDFSDYPTPKPTSMQSPKDGFAVDEELCRLLMMYTSSGYRLLMMKTGRLLLIDED